MQFRPLGRTGMSVSAISFGAWAIGGAWGTVDDTESMAALNTAIDAGVNFIDTADVYGDGRSERLIARLRRERPRDQIFVATKAGRRLPAQTPDGYTRANLTAWIDRSLTNLDVDALDLLQLHCPHRQVYDMPEVFGYLDDLVAEGKVRHYGVSVETVDEAMTAIRHPNVKTVQIIFNMFRLKPAEKFFAEARAAKVGVLARVPLASGLLTGKFGPHSTFAEDDHRGFNREGQRFANCAASVQLVLEDTLVDIARALHQETGLPDLCLGGGVALNGVANARILAESGFERVFVPPAPGDAGCALGAALFADRIYLGNPDRDVPDHPFWGPRVDAQELARAAREDGQPVEELDETPLIERIADELAAGRVVGWMDGASEFGPRALGHRSILAAPHSNNMRDRLNRDVKYREEFRPFAPVTPIEAADRYFDLPSGGARLARFMSGVFPVRTEWRERLAAITHVDGSARLQTLDRDMAPRLHALLEAYGRRSGIPVLLNTSFNVAGEPIVNRALEGYSTFRRCGIDALVAGPILVTKRPSWPTKREQEVVA